MANWYYNTLEVSGPHAEFVATRLKKHGMGYFYPRPKVLEDESCPIHSDGLPAWIKWSMATWGCKWDLEPKDIKLTVGGNGVYYLRAYSANGPIDEFCERLATDFKIRILLSWKGDEDFGVEVYN